MGARPSQRRRKARGEIPDINIIPLMNVFCILIPFLLLTAVFVQLTIIDTNLPSSSSSSTSDTAEESPTPEVAQLNLTVLITKEGFIMAGYGGVLTVEGNPEGGENGKKIIPMKVTGKDENGNDIMEYDYEKFQETLIKIKEAYPGKHSIIILPENQVKYSTIIKVLDTSREYRVKKPGAEKDDEFEVKNLFLNPVLAAGIT